MTTTASVVCWWFLVARRCQKLAGLCPLPGGEPPCPCHIGEIASLENLFAAATLARRGKSRRPDVEAWWLRRESEIGRLHEELLSGEWQPGGYRTFLIYEPKRREISAAPFADRVVHHALCRKLAPVLERRFIPRSYSCPMDKGTGAARACCRRLTNTHRHVLKCDVAKFFPSLDHAILRERLWQFVECAGTRQLIERILDSHRTTGWPAPVVLPGEEMLAAAVRARGLPIGNLTSQLWGNFCLDALDHWVTEKERHGAYLRYTDDFLLFSDDKARLWELRDGIIARLSECRLRLSLPKSRLLTTREGVPFCGFRFLPGKAPRILGATKRRFESRCRLMQADSSWADVSRFVRHWYRFSVEGNTTGLRRSYAGPRATASTLTASLQSP